MIKIEINQVEYRNYSYVKVEESLSFPFHIQAGLVPCDDKQLEDSFLHKGVLMSFSPIDGDNQRFTWIEPNKCYYGYVAQERRHYDTAGNLGEVSLEIFHPLYLLNDSCHFRIFSEKTLTEIFDTIFQTYKESWSKYKIKPPEYSSNLSQIKIPYCTQYEESDLHFFLRLCELYGAHFHLHDQKVVVYDFATQIQGEIFSIPTISRVHWRQDASSLARTLNHRNIEYTQKFYDGKSLVVTQKNEVKSTNPALPPFPYWIDMFEPNPKRSQYFLEVQKRYLQHAESDCVVYNQDFQNNEPLIGVRAGQKFLLPGMEKDKAIYVYRVHWECKGSMVCGGQGAIKQKLSYEIVFQGREIQYPFIMLANNTKPKIEGFLRATVIEPRKASDGDKERLGRIKVQILWQEKPGPTCWVRLMMPYAGSDHGYYIMPEVGDEVLIAFEGGDIDCPLCIGSVYNMDAGVLKRFDESQQITTALWKTPNNVYLKFYDTPNAKNEQTVILAVQKNSVIYMDNRSKINICVQNQESNSLICLDQDKITIHTNGQSKSVVCLDKGKIKISSEESVIVEAKEVTVQGSSEVNIKSATVNIKGGSINLGSGSAGSISVPATPGYTGDGTVG